jgi:hypothetical protein
MIVDLSFRKFWLLAQSVVRVKNSNFFFFLACDNASVNWSNENGLVRSTCLCLRLVL